MGAEECLNPVVYAPSTTRGGRDDPDRQRLPAGAQALGVAFRRTREATTLGAPPKWRRRTAPRLRTRSGILPRMHALRLAAAATVATAALVAAAIGSCDNVINLYDCGAPGLSETGADGGPDPCHCDPPPSSSYEACGCLSDPTDQTSIDQYNACILLLHEELEAGVDGGS
jgi:hypothetical protein